MRLTRLGVRDLRNLAPLELAPASGLNLVLGPNGAGKTSLLEAIHVLGYGRSFRGRIRDGLIRSGAPALEVFAEWDEGLPARSRRVGLRHAGGDWQGRLDGADIAALGQLCTALAVLCFEPGSHTLVHGPAEARRRYLDWGLFHVEPRFLPLWRRAQRALKQRNAALKRRAGDAELDAWEQELALAAEPLTALRLASLEGLQARLAAEHAALVPQLGAPGLRFQPGWRQEDMALTDALLLARDRDRQAGFTSVGPHRADWRVTHATRPAGEALSRGQAKLVALACLLAQAEAFAALRGEWPVFLLDDLAAELDASHQQRLLARLDSAGGQVWLTGTEVPAALQGRAAALFHVEQGVVVRGG